VKKTTKCPECGSEDILEFEHPGYGEAEDGNPTPDWACDACGLAGYDTAEWQEDEYRQVRDEGKAYQADTGFAKPWKPTVKIRPDNIDRKRRNINIDAETIFNGWVCQVLDKDTRICPVCNTSIPIHDISNGDCFYEPDWTPDLLDELEPQIQQGFNIPDVIADFFICQNCFNAGEQAAPRHWLQQRINQKQ
jgi:hypothetical protein